MVCVSSSSLLTRSCEDAAAVLAPFCSLTEDCTVLALDCASAAPMAHTAITPAATTARRWNGLFIRFSIRSLEAGPEPVIRLVVFKLGPVSNRRFREYREGAEFSTEAAGVSASGRQIAAGQ